MNETYKNSSIKKPCGASNDENIEIKKNAFFQLKIIHKNCSAHNIHNLFKFYQNYFSEEMNFI